MEKLNAEVDLLAESWRLNQFLKKIRSTDEKFNKKISNNVSRFEKHFKSAAEVLGLEVVDFTGTEFESGLPITPINLEDFAANENLFVASMIEPTIKVAGEATILRKGAAILGRRGR